MSARTVKNGEIHHGKQRFLCHECGRQFVEQPRKKVIDPAIRKLIDRLLLERISYNWHCTRCAGIGQMATNLRE